MSPVTTSPILDVAGLTVAFDGHEVVDGVDLRVEPGRCLALVGESGSGKSVIGRALLGLTQRDARVRSTRFTLGGTDVRDLPDRRWRRLRGATVGYVGQDALGSLDPLWTVGRTLRDVLRRNGSPVDPEELLARVGIPDRILRRYPDQLSGGQRQRVLIACALAGGPDLLVADEPTTALDATVGRRVLSLLRDTVDAGTALLLISHDLAAVAAVADDVAVMRDGRVVELGPVGQVLREPTTAYSRTLLDAAPSVRHPRRWLSAERPDLARALPDRSPSLVDGPLLQAVDLHRSFPAADGSAVVALDGVGLTIAPGTVTGVVGESGSGKSTLARVLLGLDRADRGTVTYRGRHRPQAVFQDPLGSFDPRYTVRRVLEEPLRVAGTARERRAGRVADLLDAVGLPSALAGRRPLELSGGQRQRVALARALATDPDLVICDEPVSALDVSVQAQVLDLLRGAVEELGVALLFISHDIGVVHHLADHILVMHRGAVVESGPASLLSTGARHEYTRELLAAVPDLETDREIA